MIDIVEREVSRLADPDLDSLQPITLALPDCARRDPAPSPRNGPVVPGEDATPFAGRDIIFVHGFIPEHVFARIFAADPALRRVHEPCLARSGTTEHCSTALPGNGRTTPAPSGPTLTGTSARARRTSTGATTSPSTWPVTPTGTWSPASTAPSAWSTRSTLC